jgi:3-oxo-5alpha-steroid 4-dehydrogenase
MDAIDAVAAIPAHEVRFARTTDVIVVGLGIAGCCAALGARESGADVVALECTGGAGGTSAMSGGVLYLGGGTAVQRACGFQDSADAMHRFLTAALGPGVDEERLAAYCSGSVEHFDWLVSLGLPFRAAFCDEPNRESADDAGLLFSGGEDGFPFDELTPPVPRGHKPQWIDSAGSFLMRTLAERVARSGARVTTDARVERLVMDGGSVVGVVATIDGTRTAIRTRGGVVLASGGFIHSPALVEQHCPLAHRPRDVWRLGVPDNDGIGIRLGVGAGGATSRMDSFECALPLGPPHRLARGILVNRRGERFINEDTYTGRIGLAALKEQDGDILMIVDDVIQERNLVGLRPQWGAPTPEELAVDCGLPPDRFTATIRDYNHHAARGEDPQFHKRAPFLRPLGAPPATGLGAIDLNVEHGAIYATFTLGGLATDVDARVLDASGDAVPGLYAAGRVAACLAARNYVSGISLGDGSFFGRRAGMHAARVTCT